MHNRPETIQFLTALSQNHRPHPAHHHITWIIGSDKRRLINQPRCNIGKPCLLSGVEGSREETGLDFPSRSWRSGWCLVPIAIFQINSKHWGSKKQHPRKQHQKPDYIARVHILVPAIRKRPLTFLPNWTAPQNAGANPVVSELDGCCPLQQTSSEFLGV